MVLLAPTNGAAGSWFELGWAAKSGKRLVVAHDDPVKRRQSIFTSLAEISCSDADVVRHVDAMGGGR